jgi:hypothetical protein
MDEMAGLEVVQETPEKPHQSAILTINKGVLGGNQESQMLM